MPVSKRARLPKKYAKKSTSHLSMTTNYRLAARVVDIIKNLGNYICGVQIPRKKKLILRDCYGLTGKTS
jgi:hypothetical protein